MNRFMENCAMTIATWILIGIMAILAVIIIGAWMVWAIALIGYRRFCVWINRVYASKLDLAFNADLY
jgi:hypothetical protein